MKTAEKTLEHQIQFWALLGPFILLLVLFISLIKASFTHVYLPFSALVGILLCWKWKMRGLAASFGLLAAVVAYHYPNTSAGERFWLIGMGMSTALSFVVTALSFEEAASLVGGLQVESKSRLDNLWSLDEKLKEMREQLESERDSLALKLGYTQEKSIENKEQMNSYKELLSIARQEVLAGEKEREQLRRELVEKRTEALKAQEDLEDFEKNSPIFEAEELRRTEGMYKQLREQFTEKTRLLDATRRELFLVQEKLSVRERELKEEHIQSITDLEQHIVSFEKEKIESDAEHEKEIDALLEVISSLATNQPDMVAFREIEMKIQNRLKS